jgi:hypothetical protein
LSSGVLTEAGAKPPEPVIKRLRYTGASGEHACMGAALGPDWHSSFDIQGPQGEAKPTISVEYETEVQQIIKKGEEGILSHYYFYKPPPYYVFRSLKMVQH